mgnify:CR=1 FL=1
MNPDGVFFSNGPGDPAALEYVVDAVRGAFGGDFVSSEMFWGASPSTLPSIRLEKLEGETRIVFVEL